MANDVESDEGEGPSDEDDAPNSDQMLWPRRL
jgi:hypothetical protein